MPASKDQGILYFVAAAMYRFLILARIGSGGLCSESWRVLHQHSELAASLL